MNTDSDNFQQENESSVLAGDLAEAVEMGPTLEQGVRKGLSEAVTSELRCRLRPSPPTRL